MDSSDVIIACSRDEDRSPLADLFRNRGDRVIPVEDAATAGAAVLSTQARYLVLDLRLPGLDHDFLNRALGSEAVAASESLETVERNHIARVLRSTGSNRSRAARILGVSRSTLHAKIRKYQIE
jgi:DNA-binding NtrC family response regulator